MSLVKGQIKLEDLKIEEVKSKQIITGALVLEIKDSEDKDKAAWPYIYIYIYI